MYQHRQQDGNQNHGGYWNIDPAVFFFNPDVARQPPKPVHFIMKEINQDPGQHQERSGDNDVFARILIHFSNLQRSGGRNNDRFEHEVDIMFNDGAGEYFRFRTG